MVIPLSVIVLTYNEENNLPLCLSSVKDLGCEVFVVDSGSTDRTVNVATEFGAKVIVHPFESHARQWNWALRNLLFQDEWVLCMDADHRLTPELTQEILELFNCQDANPKGRKSGIKRKPSLKKIDGFYIRRRQIFRGKWIRHGGYYPKYLLKLIRHGRAWSDENELLDFRLYVKGRTLALQHDLIEDNENDADILFWISKHTRFALLQAKEEFLRRKNGTGWSVKPSLFGTPDQRTLWRKRLWYHMPLYVRPFVYFIYRYFVRFGFLDGKQGFIFHFLQAFWYRLLVDVVLEYLHHDPSHGAAEREAALLANRVVQSLKSRTSQR